MECLVPGGTTPRCRTRRNWLHRRRTRADARPERIPSRRRSGHRLRPVGRGHDRAQLSLLKVYRVCQLVRPVTANVYAMREGRMDRVSEAAVEYISQVVNSLDALHRRYHASRAGAWADSDRDMRHEPLRCRDLQLPSSRRDFEPRCGEFLSDADFAGGRFAGPSHAPRAGREICNQHTGCAWSGSVDRHRLR